MGLAWNFILDFLTVFKINFAFNIGQKKTSILNIGKRFSWCSFYWCMVMIFLSESKCQINFFGHSAKSCFVLLHRIYHHTFLLRQTCVFAQSKSISCMYISSYPDITVSFVQLALCECMNWSHLV